MTIAKVQHVQGNANGGASLTLTLNGVAAGNSLHLQLTSRAATSQDPLSLTGDVSWTLDKKSLNPANNSISEPSHVYVYSAFNVSAGNKSVNINMDAALLGRIHATLTEVSGLGAGSLDVTAHANGNAPSNGTGCATITSAATSQADELVLVSVAVNRAGSANVALAAPSTGYTQLGAQSDSNAWVGSEHAYKVVSAAGAQSATWVHNRGEWTTVLATYKAGAAISPIAGAANTSVNASGNLAAKGALVGTAVNAMAMAGELLGRASLQGSVSCSITASGSAFVILPASTPIDVMRDASMPGTVTRDTTEDLPALRASNGSLGAGRPHVPAINAIRA